jgi:hypothetical protein
VAAVAAAAVAAAAVAAAVASAAVVPTAEVAVVVACDNMHFGHISQFCFVLLS